MFEIKLKESQIYEKSERIKDSEKVFLCKESDINEYDVLINKKRNISPPENTDILVKVKEPIICLPKSESESESVSQYEEKMVINYWTFVFDNG